MARRRKEENNSSGQDSFLDIVGNIVGILIILVLVVGVRVKNAPVTLSIPDPRREAEEKTLREDLQTEAAIRSDVLQAAEKINTIQNSLVVQDAIRSNLATKKALLEKEIDSRQKELGSQKQKEFRQGQKLTEANRQLALLQMALEQQEREKPKTEKVASYPTPISQTVHGNEIHLQLQGNCVAIVPMDEMIEVLKADFQEQLHRMQYQDEMTRRLGPLGGFRMQYVMERHVIPVDSARRPGRGGMYVRLKRFTLMPVAQQIGEPIDVALQKDSELLELLAKHHPGRTTVTVWTYPESFNAFRRLKERLFQLGYATAGRPLPEGIPIGASPDGSRSSAQ